jgi:hypothetical protein
MGSTMRVTFHAFHLSAQGWSAVHTTPKILKNCNLHSVTMESLAVLGLVANSVKFVDLGDRIIRPAKEIQASADGTTRENKSLQEVTAVSTACFTTRM